MNNKSLAISILAAGKGTRMDSSIPKVLHKLNGIPMIAHVINTSNKFNPEKLIIIVGYKKNLIKDTLKNYNVKYVVQKEQKGTAHAIKQCSDELKNFRGDLLILSGDVPLISQKTITSFIQLHYINKSKASLITTVFNDPSGYGRVIRDRKKQFKKIVEHKDANVNELKIKEINAGIYLFDSKILFEKIHLIKNNNAQKEFYIVDIFNYIDSKDISVFLTKNNKEISGINTIEQLRKLNQ